MFYDCVIVGGGGVGASLALTLGQLNYRVLLLEKNSLQKNVFQDDFHARTLGLSFASSCIYSALGVWDKIALSAIPIKRVDVSVKGQFGASRLCPQNNHPSLGFVVSVQDLEMILYNELAKEKMIDVFENTDLTSYKNNMNSWDLLVSSSAGTQKLSCRLLIGADGANSFLRQAQGIPSKTRHYQHYALMTNIRIDPSLHFKAIERFLKNGAIALLPWKENIATCVWTVEKKDAEILKTYCDSTYLEACQQQLGKRLGSIVEIGKRICVPLQMQLAQNQIANRFLLMGNAAHSLHPIAAQGFNLSLRDIWQIRSQILNNPQRCDLGCKEFLNEYLHARLKDQDRVIFATDKIARFMSGGPLPSWLRAMGITLFDCATPVKSLFTRYSMGFAG